MLALLGADDNLKASYGIYGGDHEFIKWCAKEVWMEQLLTEASRMLSQVVERNIGGEELTLPEHPTLAEYFNNILFRYRDTLFEPLSKEMTIASPAIKQVDFPNASRRVVYRFLLHLLGNKKIHSLPHICKAWPMLSPPSFCMYTANIFREDRKPTGAFLFSDWERKHCPSWIDMKKGDCIEEENEAYAKHQKGDCRSDSGSVGNMNEDTLRQVQEQQRKILEAQKQQLEQLPARTGRPKVVTVVDTQERDCADGEIASLMI
ncbi:hypothetical protein L7F22_035029 [Adiantum nelumboides]|nr:hypothetical protein [Adiantum nelumboides]